MTSDKNPVYLTIKESRAVQRLIEQACADEFCGYVGCENIRRRVGAVRRLVARLDILLHVLDGAE